MAVLRGWSLGRRHRDQHEDGFWLHRVHPPRTGPDATSVRRARSVAVRWGSPVPRVAVGILPFMTALGLDEDRPVGVRRLLNRLAIWLRGGDHRAVDLYEYHVRVDGHRIVKVSTDVARDLLDAPFATPAEQARTLQRLVSHARRVDGHYELPIVRTRLMGPTTVAPVYIADRDHDEWVAYWWYED